MTTALIDALRSATACILGAEALASYRPDPAAVLALLDGAERDLDQARAELVQPAAMEAKPCA